MITEMTPQDQAQIAVAKLNELGATCSLSDVTIAPQVVRIEVDPGPRALMHHFTRLHRADDLAFILAAESVRIIAPVPGRSTVAIEVDRKDRETVRFSNLPSARKPLIANLGVDVDGRPGELPLTSAPHVLVAGHSGSGKTTALHTILCQLIDSHTPAELQLLLVDTKRVELTAYEDAPHLAAPVADNAQGAIRQLRGAVLTMERRFEVLHGLGARDIVEANRILEARGEQTIPFAVIVADEIADLMLASSKQVESLLVRLAQKGRAAGMVLILATQYPLSTIYTGLLRVNIPSRLAFAVPDKTASRVILDQHGAETLRGCGDGLLSLTGSPLIRFQGAYCSPDDIAGVIDRANRKENT
jgi:DNA segregation ATPase FtsK/SpoIIIE, S-DNA-T family